MIKGNVALVWQLNIAQAELGKTWLYLQHVIQLNQNCHWWLFKCSSVIYMYIIFHCIKLFSVFRFGVVLKHHASCLYSCVSFHAALVLQLMTIISLATVNSVTDFVLFFQCCISLLFLTCDRDYCADIRYMLSELIVVGLFKASDYCCACWNSRRLGKLWVVSMPLVCSIFLHFYCPMLRG